MTDDDKQKLYLLADLIHAISRQLTTPTNLKPAPCTSVEILVMRYIRQNAGASARDAAEATLLPSSNFSRILRGLTEKGLLRQEKDTRDARGKKLYLTDVAKTNFSLMREAWSKDLEGLIEDSDQIDLVNTTLKDIETKLLARRRTDNSASA
ncbi:MarR family transcriptional regulator [Gluconobacter cerevisiae]|uniref:MarR family transcriptional regulator n=1 Tax=Gluconobacter cerevisiae TaxID=1379734 RepID=A0ABR9YFF6_9PROT|nr:MarR family winged helix-turn-helix transcriptional regulator [Gluconobacter cerevisiae]MBF0877201.1 MarR family transcriptional regulator [Gluconobacter cerevisiae]